MGRKKLEGITAVEKSSPHFPRFRKSSILGKRGLSWNPDLGVSQNVFRIRLENVTKKCISEQVI